MNELTRNLAKVDVEIKMVLVQPIRSKRLFARLQLAQIGVELIGLGGHDEVVLMQAFDLMRPPGHRNLAPFCADDRMMALLLGEFPHFLGEGQRLGEILELEGAPQARDVIFLH